MCFYDSWIDEESGTVNFITELFTSGTLRQYVLADAVRSDVQCSSSLHATEAVLQVPTETQEPWEERAEEVGMANSSGTRVPAWAQSTDHTPRSEV